MKKGFSGIKAVSLRTLYVTMVICASVAALSMLYVIWGSLSNYRTMLSSTENYILSQRHASNLLASSDFLTEHILSFAVTGDKIQADEYFKEATDSSRRENALKSLELLFSSSNAQVPLKKASAASLRKSALAIDAYVHMKNALDRSNALMDLEHRVMCLVISATGQDIMKYPRVLQEFELSREEQLLSSEEKKSRALMLLVGEKYLNAKQKIRADVSKCIDLLVLETQRRQEENVDMLHRIMLLQFVLVGFLLLMVLAFVLLTSLMVVRPLRRNIGLMLNQKELPENGAYELKCFAHTYNTLFRMNREHHRKLAYDAEHDALTGVYNRSSFERVFSANAQCNFALLLVDVDRFKNVNDTYGHEVGDNILKKVAYMLLTAFREEDFVFRIGGDEFAVIMMHAKSELKSVVESKMLRCNHDLMSSDDGLPHVSLSVGVAFSDNKNGSGDLFKDADSALYAIKNRGRNGVAFYGMDEETVN